VNIEKLETEGIMENLIAEYLLSLQFGEMLVHKNLAVMPVFSAANGERM
jgi:hypothetical protein